MGRTGAYQKHCWAEHFDLGSLTNKRIELRSELVKKTELKSFTNYMEYWESLLSNLDYLAPALKAISILVRVPSTASTYL